MKTKLLLLAVAVLAVAPLYGQSFNPDRGNQNANPPTVGKPAPEQPKLARPVLYVDVKMVGQDSTFQRYLDPISTGLGEAFDLKGGSVPKGETGFEVRVFVINKDDTDFVTVILLVKPVADEPLRLYLGSETRVITKDKAEHDGEETFEGMQAAIEAFLDRWNDDKGNH